MDRPQKKKKSTPRIFEYSCQAPQVAEVGCLVRRTCSLELADYVTLGPTQDYIHKAVAPLTVKSLLVSYRFHRQVHVFP